MNRLNREAFDTFYRNYSRPFWLYVFRICGEEALADEIFQESFFRFLKKIPPGLNEYQQKAYLYRIASRLVIDRARRKKREVESRRDFEHIYDNPKQDPLVHDMRVIFSELKPKERSLLWLAYVEGRDHREISKMMGMGEKSVKVLLFRARKKLSGLIQIKGYKNEKAIQEQSFTQQP